MTRSRNAKANTWKLQDAKARFSEVVRKARAGHPQHVTVHGQEAVVISDAKRFEVRPKPASAPLTMKEFIEASKKYRGCAEGIDFDTSTMMDVTPRPIFSSEHDRNEK
jgi:prevent-host-death family protein